MAFQVIFTRLTTRSLSPLNDGQRQCINILLTLPIIGVHLPLARSLFKKSWNPIDIVKLRNYTSSQVKKEFTHSSSEEFTCNFMMSNFHDVVHNGKCINMIEVANFTLRDNIKFCCILIPILHPFLKQGIHVTFSQVACSTQGYVLQQTQG